MVKLINLSQELYKHFHYKEFKGGQEDIINAVLKKKNVLGVLPTGSGKSLCYQLPAQVLPGLTIVVSPLISLMIDQVKELKAIKYKGVAALHGMISWQERQHILNHIIDYRLLYISPELLQSKEVMHFLLQVNVSLFVIDEAHCISQWGFDFRPDYLRLVEKINVLGNPTILALTATASEKVRTDIKTQLKCVDMIEKIYPMDRENIILNVENVVDEADKRIKLIKVLKKNNVPVLIYFSSRKKAEEMTYFLAMELPERNIAFYHGGMDSTDRLSVQQQFMNDQLSIICCTTAFGMGINKSDIRLIVHYHLPLEIESFIQEIGRAGRDGKESASILFYNKSDINIPLSIIENQYLSKKELVESLNKIKNLDEILPNEKEMEEYLRINEIQWRNIKYQLENHGMIRGSDIIKCSQQWETTINAMIDDNFQRENIKRIGLNEMIAWIQSEDCLRKTLYSKFQKKYKKPAKYCCSNCDFNIFKWENNLLRLDQTNQISWQHKLKNILQLSDNNE